MRVGATVREILRLARRFLGPGVVLALIVLAPLELVASLVDPTIDAPFENTSLFVALSIGTGAVAFPWVQGALTRMFADARGDVRSAAAALGGLEGRVWSLVAVTVVGGILVLLGFVLLIVPGIVIASRLSVAVPAVVLERKSWVDAFRRSNELVKGHTWPVMLVVFLATVVALAVVVVPAGAAFLLDGDGVLGTWLGTLVLDVAVVYVLAATAYVLYTRLARPTERQSRTPQ